MNQYGYSFDAENDSLEHSLAVISDQEKYQSMINLYISIYNSLEKEFNEDTKKKKVQTLAKTIVVIKLKSSTYPNVKLPDTLEFAMLPITVWLCLIIYIITIFL